MTPTGQPAPETAGWEHPTRLFRLTVVLGPDPWTTRYGCRCSLGLSVALTGSTRESRSDALIRTRTADEKLLAYRQAPRFHSALRSGTPR